VCGLECRRHHVAAFFHLLLGKLYDQNGILGHQTYEHHQADLKIDVVFQTANPDTQIGTDSGYGQRENDRDGHRPALVLGGEAGESETFTITTTAAWKAVPSGEGFTLDKTEGTGDATVRVTAAAGNWDGYVKQLGSIEIAATNVDGVKTVSVSQDEITPVLPSEVTLVADFTLGASVATPELPPYSTDNFTTGRHEYTIGGYTFAIFVDPDEGGKFYWLDNKQFSPSIPDPAQGLFFSKLGAYVEFPAIAGKVLSEVHYLPTSQQNDVSLDLFGADNSEPQYTLDYGDDGTWSYTLIDARENLRYRIEITNKKNAQLAKLKLVYAAAK